MTKESYGAVFYKEPGLETYKIYVGNLAPQTSDQDLRNKFEKYGPVIEASALPGKGFGFVHMANEDVGAKAMKSLYKTFLHGKEMVIQPAVNPKRAQQYNSNRRSFFGRGSSNLDNFDDKDRQYDQCQYIEREINNVISADTPPPRSPTHDFQPFSNKMQSSMSNLNGFDSRNNNFNGIGAYSATSPTNMLGANGAGSLLFQGSNGSSRMNAWQMQSGSLNANSLLQSNKDGISGLSGDPFLLKAESQGLKYASNKEQRIQVLNSKLNDLQVLLLANPGNSTLIEGINGIHKDLSFHQQEKSLAQKLVEEQEFQLNEKKKEMQQQWSTSLGSQGQVGNSLGMNSLHSSNFLPTSMNKSIFDEGMNGLLDMNSTGISLNSFNSVNQLSGMNLMPGRDQLLSSTLLSANLNGAGGESPSLSCSLCKLPYDTDQHVPKLLGCTHTFCLSCLKVHANVLGNGENHMRCPGNCGLTTELQEGGVARLTNNQGIMSLLATSVSAVDMSALRQSLTNLNMDEEVCASCTSVDNRPGPLSACREAGHSLVRAQDAISLIVTKLRPIVHDSLESLNEALHIRKGLNTRIEFAIASSEKFTDELRKKRHNEEKMERSLLWMLNELLTVKDNLDNQSYAQLVKTYHSVDSCAKEAKNKHAEAKENDLLSKAVRSLSLDMHEGALNKLMHSGICRNEGFDLDKNLMIHAENGNHANAMLHYLATDLLTSRTNRARALALYNGGSAGFGMNGLSPTMDGTMCVDATIFSKLNESAVVTPDISNLNGNLDGSANMENDFDDIENLLKTTERIEAETAKEKKKLNELNNEPMGLVTNIGQLMNHVETADIEVEDQFLENVNMMSVQDSYKSSENDIKASAAKVPDSSDAHDNADSVASSDSGITSNGNVKAFSYLDAAKKPAKPQPEHPKMDIVKMPLHLKPAKSPHCWMKLAVDGKTIGRIVFQLRPDKAPRMCENFMGLCNGTEEGLGYRNTHFFKNGDGFLAGGDVEYDDGSGGYSIFNDSNFEADLCPLKDEVGMIRFKGNGTSDAGRGMVGSQFMIWYAEREFKKFAFSLVFGRVVDGMDVVKKAANVNLNKSDVIIEECGSTM